MTDARVAADLRLRARPHPYDPLVAVADVPDGLAIDERSEITDERGRPYAYACGTDFERFASTAPFSCRRFFRLGHELHVLPPDTRVLLLTL